MRPAGWKPKRWLGAAALLAMSSPTLAQDTEAQLRALVTELSDDALGGRVPAGVGEAETLTIITREFAAAGLTPAGLAGTWFQPVALPNRPDPNADRRVSYNVIGRLPGTNPAAGAVLLTAHWDAQGTCGIEGDADRICNGAVDNASGTAALMLLARRIAASGSRKRDIVFVATTAEEQGLVGAYALAALPIAPTERIAAVLNMDTIAITGPDAPVAVIGGSQAFKALVADVAREKGRAFDGDDEADSFVRRQDGWAFAQLGVPAALVSGSFSDMERLTAYLAGDYHKASDEVARADLSGAAADVAIYEGIVNRLADPARWTIEPLAPPPPPPSPPQP